MINPKDVEFQTTKGTGPGGQYKNKVETAVRAIHKPTGLKVLVDDERSQYQNKKKALKLLNDKLRESIQKELAAKRKARRDAKIKERDIIRTYTKNRVKDHRTKRSASIKDVLRHGKIELIAPD